MSNPAPHSVVEDAMIQSIETLKKYRASYSNAHKSPWVFALANMARAEGEPDVKAMAEYMGEWFPIVSLARPEFRIKMEAIAARFPREAGFLSDYPTLHNKLNLGVQNGKVSYLPLAKVRDFLIQKIEAIIVELMDKYDAWGIGSTLNNIIEDVLYYGIHDYFNKTYTEVLRSGALDKLRVVCKAGRIFQELGEVTGHPMSESVISKISSYFVDLTRLDEANLDAPDTKVYILEKPSEVYTSEKLVARSCMSVKDSRTFWMYDDLDICEIVTIEKDGYIVARALLWNKVHVKGQLTPIKYMDRIYANSTHNETLLRKWGMLEGYHQWYTSDYIMTPQGMRIDKPQMWIDLGDNFKPLMWPKCPYMDTFAVFVEGGHTLRSWWERGQQNEDCKVLNGDVHGLTYIYRNCEKHNLGWMETSTCGECPECRRERERREDEMKAA